MFSRYAERLNRIRRHGVTDGSGAEPLRHTYDPESETHRYQYTPPSKQKTERPHALHVLIRVAEILLAFTLAGLAAHTIAVYEHTKDATMRYPRGNTLPAWPHGGANVGPTVVLIVAAAWTIFYNLVALIAGIGFLNKLRTGFCGRFAYFIFFTFTVLLWAAVLAYAKLPPKYTYARNDLYNWSCEHKDFEVVVHRDTIGLGQICTETTVAWYFGIIIGLFEVLNFVSMIFGVCTGHTKRRSTASVIPFQANPYRKIDVPAPGQDAPMMDSRGQMS